MFHFKTKAFVLCSCLMTAVFVRGQEPAAPAAANHQPEQANGGRSFDLNSIDAAIKANDNYQVQQALEDTVALLNDVKNAQKTADKIPVWLHELMTQRRLEDVEEYAVAMIDARPADLRLIEACQQSRIRAKLLANKPQEALPLAKSFYNVCAMPNTSKAIDLISECLYDMAENGDPAGAVKRFKLEQIHGAATSQPATSDHNTLLQIPIDPKQYSAGLEQVELVDNGWEALMGKGNLLLLSGQPKEAAKVFEKAYSLASDNNLAAATEAVARAMRAEDGTVGRANAWILSLRPPEQAAQ